MPRSSIRMVIPELRVRGTGDDPQLDLTDDLEDLKIAILEQVQAD